MCETGVRTLAPASQPDAYLGGGHGHQIHPGVGFAQHVVAARGVGEDLHAIQPHVDVRAAGGSGSGDRRAPQLALPAPQTLGVSPQTTALTPGRLQSPGLLRGERGSGGSGQTDLWGVQSSSQTSLPMQVSCVASTASPKGTVSCSQEARGCGTLSCPHLDYVLT